MPPAGTSCPAMLTLKQFITISKIFQTGREKRQILKLLKNYDQDQDPKRSPQISDVSAVSNFCNEVDIGNDDEKKMVQ